jgi:cellulose synthase/poly-beta-1,6-N-acetylglucosamine synthase-like glycosyltransferase
MILNVLAILVLCYAIAIEATILLLAVGSGFSLKRDRYVSRYRRIEDLLSSDTVPPVSIIVPAYNEEFGIADSIRSMQMLKYPKIEIIVVNDGSSDTTLERLIEAFKMVEVVAPYRTDIDTQPIRAVYQSTMSIPLMVIDKENGGKADALNAGTNLAKYPYVLLTDADVIMDEFCVLRAMRHVVEDRVRTVAVGGNIRPANGCDVVFGRVVEPRVPDKMLERVQLLEYLRSFVASRPAWSRINGLPLISGAFGIFRRDVLAAVGGMTRGHLGEDLDLTMRIHRHMRDNDLPYRITYAPDCVAWTEVPNSTKVLRTQRIRWHRGLVRAVGDFRGMTFNPKYGAVGMVGWPAQVFIEYLAPMVEFVGWFVLPLAFVLGVLNLSVALPLMVIAFFVGAINSILALYLDEVYGYFNSPLEAIRLLGLAFVENLGWRQRTVWWRIRAMVPTRDQHRWGEMKRVGVGNLAARK